MQLDFVDIKLFYNSMVRDCAKISGGIHTAIQYRHSHCHSVLPDHDVPMIAVICLSQKVGKQVFTLK